ncbi:metal-dependent transcriptional regulator [Paratissierella segnis]|jgi:Mn-dependent DtxR family transcriptional regulator|uniref:Metal-dependent transcriptional regulator n=1 Tax=Paratissierella segnis TaxID=2763679 RepID=A0A926ERB2_9FIRM|nr:metal-dependent transcriptional regulator [Paratissierella segnis]MBC8587075.1 metal-dependent transcriptional regulator [Paratissierella segnis]
MNESREMYLETILILKKRNEHVRSIDVARELNFSKASVSRAVGILKDDDFITVDANGYIELTEKGTRKSKDIYNKHKVLTSFFINVIKVSPEIAEEDACKIEHVISDDTFKGIEKYLADNKNN